MKKEQEEPKVWAEIGIFKEDRLQWVEVVKVKKGSKETLEGLLARRLASLESLNLELRIRHWKSVNGRNIVSDWTMVKP